MRFTSTILLVITAIGRHTDAAGHLRSKTVKRDHVQYEELNQVGAILEMKKELHNERFLQGDTVPAYEIHPKDSMGSVDALTTQSVRSNVDMGKQKEKASLEKHEKMNTLAADTVPAYAIHPKDPMGSVDALTTQSVRSNVDMGKQKEKASLEKHEKMHAPVGDTVPAYEIHPKDSMGSVDELTTQSVSNTVVLSGRVKSAMESTSDAMNANDSFGIKIVGGDASDANEFPYFGT